MNPQSVLQDNTRRILRERARALARPPASECAARTTIEVIEFGLAHERYAFESNHVRGVHALEDLTPLPCTPSFVAGIVNVRGHIVAVIDIKKFFDLPERGILDAHHILLVQGNDMELAILADFVTGVRTIPTDAIRPTLPTLTGIREDYLKGVTVDRLVILDAVRMTADRRIIVQDEAEF